MKFIEIDQFCKTIKKHTVLDRVNLSVEKGEIVGIVGYNGSGKTMLLRAIGGLIYPDSGTLRINGELMGKDISFPPSVGMIIENVGLWPYLNGMENLRMLAKIKNIIGDREIADTIRRVGLDPEDKRHYRKYSLGMKQRLVIAQAIMESPDLLLLDEPTNALDEGGVAEVRSLIAEERARGATVILASHNRDDIEQLCDRVYTMRAGTLSEREDG